MSKINLIPGLKADIEDLLTKSFAYQSCINCEKFDEPNEKCKLYNQRPPARVIVYGCKQWEAKDEIPF